MKKENFELTHCEKKNYLLPEKRDFIILSKIKKLEKKKLQEKDKQIIKFIRAQLKKDWRTPIISILNKLLKKYKK